MNASVRGPRYAAIDGNGADVELSLGPTFLCQRTGPDSILNTLVARSRTSFGVSHSLEDELNNALEVHSRPTR
jgi:hypothetical protein